VPHARPLLKVKLAYKAEQAASIAARQTVALRQRLGGLPPRYEASRTAVYRQAVETGEGPAMAMNNLGWMYQSGRGVAKDDEAAARWLFASIEKSHTFSAWRITNACIVTGLKHGPAIFSIAPFRH
jgi:TPR repeat protein